MSVVRVFWPRTPQDEADKRFVESPPPGTSKDYIAAYRDHKICGCGDALETDRERKRGICEMCRKSGLRTVRP